MTHEKFRKKFLNTGSNLGILYVVCNLFINSKYCIMFKNLFKRKTKLEKLQEKHKMLLDKSFRNFYY